MTNEPKLTRKDKHLLAVWCGVKDYAALGRDALLADIIKVSDMLKKHEEVNAFQFAGEHKQIAALCKRFHIVR